jgi:hypothetical protein
MRYPGMKNSKKKEILILFCVFIIGFALRFYAFDHKSLWMDEIYTFQDSGDGFREQLNFYKENPTFLHPPLFFVLTHLFYPFSKPERDLRIIPLIFGALSVIMIYLLAKEFSPPIALPCALSLAFMTYHISLSQDGRSYSMLMFLGMAGLYFFIKHLKTSKKGYLLLVALFFSALFYTSYSSIPFIVLSQILWFYQINEEGKKLNLSSLSTLNGFILVFCLPWVVFLAINYSSQPLMDPRHTESSGSFWYILYSVIHDWTPHAFLIIVSVLLLFFSPIFSKNRKNAILLLAILILPIGGLHIFCKLLVISHFVSSKYFINFLPLFFITLYLSLDGIEVKFERLRSFLRFKPLFVIILIMSNLMILPLYYRSEKQNFRDLVTFLKNQLQDGDKIIDLERMGTLGILYYFGASPERRHYILDFMKISGKEIEYKKSFLYRNHKFTIYHSTKCCDQYVSDGGRTWIVTSKWGAKKIKNDFPHALVGYFDGSFYSANLFPSDASMYLFLWDPSSPGEKGIDMPIE